MWLSFSTIMEKYGMDLKEPKTFAELVSRLKEHHMEVEDELFAEQFLRRVNYYRFTGYALQFRVAPHDSDYVKGTTFETVVQIYDFDTELRNLLKKWIEVLEVYYRAQIANAFSLAKCKKPPHNQHYDFSNYYNKKDAEEIFDDFKKQKKYYKDTLVLQHHQVKYGDYYPLWVIVEMISLSDLSKLYSCMYNSNQDEIANHVGTGRSVLKNHLHCLSVLRNKCAHAARLYNTELKPSAQLPPNFLRNNLSVKSNSLFAYIFVVMRRLPEETMKDSLICELRSIIQKYEDSINLSVMGFPEKYAQILTDNK